MKFDQEIESNCKINPLDYENEIVIKNNFLFAIINIDLAQDLNIAAIFVNYVKKEKLTKKI